MSFTENLQYLRKWNKITQEELADELGVSRQAVSKWETGEAYPETDKLIILCDKFGVTLDELVRGDISAREREEKPAENANKWHIYPDEYGFKRQMDRFSAAMATGVFLILLGVAVCVAICGYSETVRLTDGNLASVIAGLSAVPLLILIAAAVFLFVFFGISQERFKKTHPEIRNVFTKKECDDFSRRFTVGMALLVSGVLVDVVFLIVMIMLAEAGVINGGGDVTSYIVAAFLFILSFIVGGLVYFGIQHEKFNVSEYNKNNVKEASARSKLKDAICSSIMLLATATFLILGFTLGLWKYVWIVFPVGGILCGIVGAIMGAKDDHD